MSHYCLKDVSGLHLFIHIACGNMQTCPAKLKVAAEGANLSRGVMFFAVINVTPRYISSCVCFFMFGFAGGLLTCC